MPGYVRKYGALELKRSYQRNLTLGISISATIFMIATFSLDLLVHTKGDSEGRRMVVVRSIAQLISPPPPPVISESPSRQTLAGGPFRPVPAARETQRLSKGRYYGEIYGMVFDRSAEGAMAGSDSAGYVHIGVPSRKSLSRIRLVETDRMPECVSAVVPTYPKLARENRIEGEVWLQVLVDEHGDVGEVRVSRKSKSDVGFEHAAMDAALKWKYRPALCNRKPVAVWILYTLKFRLASVNQDRAAVRHSSAVGKLA